MGTLQSSFSRDTLIFLVLGLILGVGGGYYGTFAVYQPQMNDHHEQIDSLAAEVSRLNLTVSVLELEISCERDVNSLLEERISGLESQISRLQSRADVLYGDITVEQTIELNETVESLVVLDVRSYEEYRSHHIGGSINIPVEALQYNLEEFEKDDEILVYCKSGGRSSRAMKILSDSGFSKVYNMLGGIDAWMKEGHPTHGCKCLLG